MQCFNCGFHNMPGSRGCGRCGANFALATTAIDVQPPRASHWRKWFAGATAAVTRLVARRQPPRLPERMITALDLPSAVAASFFAVLSVPTRLVPGLPQAVAGRRLLGVGIFAAWILLLAAGISCLFTLLGGLLLAAAVSLHAFSAASSAAVVVHTFPVRLVRNVGFGLAMLTICYLPAIWLANREVFPLGVYMDRPPLAAGDVVWCRRREPPRPGEIWYVASRRPVVRVRAVAGQQITWRGGLLLVDGEPSPWQPADWAFPDGTSETLGPGEVLVFDVTFLPPDADAPGRRTYNYNGIGLRQLLRQSGAVSRLDGPQSGRVMFRSYPWHRIGRVD